MIIDRKLGPYIVLSEDSVLSALQKLINNRRRYLCAVSQHGCLEGVLTDGDIRNWLVKTKNADLQRPVSDAMNRACVSVSIDETPEVILRHFSKVVHFVPLVDDSQHLVAIARIGHEELVIEDRVISADGPTFIIAEIGVNHNGDVDIARSLIRAAAEAGADCAKFQLRDMATLYRNAGDPNDASADLGAQYALDVLTRAELPVATMLELFDYCRECGIIPLCTPMDLASLKVLADYGMAAYKTASCDLTNHDLLTAIAKTQRPMLCSTGMSSEAEIQATVQHLRKLNASFALLHCNSTYPVPFKDINLRYLEHLREFSGTVVGYSGHERGIHVPMAAVSLGARIIEKHITYDRNADGRDHRVSLLPDEFTQMVKGIREIEDSMGQGTARSITQGELMNREILGKSLTANRPLVVGDIITDDAISVMCPGQGLAPYFRPKLVGKVCTRDMKVGDQFFATDLEETLYKPRAFAFDRPYGVPVRYHDALNIAALAPLDFLEFHMSFKDLECKPTDFFSEPLDLGMVVHSPDFYVNDFILDLCAADEAVRSRSIHELQNLIDITRSLKPYFLRAQRPLIVTSVGGYTENAFLDRAGVEACYARLIDSMSQIDQEGVEVLFQTMPPFPWYFGGQRYMNVLLHADDIVKLCAENGYRICLDISHSKLACTHYKTSFEEFLEKVAPYAAHLHIVDAKGVDSEGLQIGEGDVDFATVARILRQACPDASFIPEIWQGHKNRGRGFWEALTKLEAWF